jgi:DNA invertase Pin-like site-specific DNA recombinase
METSDSAEKQIELCREYAKRKGYDVVGVYQDEGASRNDAERLGMAAAVENVRRGTVLLCYELSRFGAGHVAVSLEQQITKKGGTVEFVQGFHISDSPDTKLIRDIMYAIKEYERQMIGARTKVRMQMHQRAGRLMSKIPPYGYGATEEKRLVPLDHEQACVTVMRDMHADGRSLREICEALEERFGAEGRRGERWDRTTVRRVLIREGVYQKRGKNDKVAAADRAGEGTL